MKRYLTAVIIAIVLNILLAYPLMLLWNCCLVPAVDILREVSWLQMFGISILVNIFTRDNITLKK